MAIDRKILVWGGVGLGALALVALAVWYYYSRKKNAEILEADTTDAGNVTLSGGGTTTSGGGVTTSGGNVNLGGSGEGSGEGSGGGGSTAQYTVYDPESEQGEGLILFKMGLIEQDPAIMEQIKREKQIGRFLFAGLDGSVWCSSGICRPIKTDAENFFAMEMSPDMSLFDWNDYGTWGIYTDGQKPSLRNDLQRIKDYDGSKNIDLFVNLENTFPLSDFGGLTPFKTHGDIYRKHEKKVLNNLQTWSTNYINEMDRLQEWVRSAAILTLQDEGIRFQGINA